MAVQSFADAGLAVVSSGGSSAVAAGTIENWTVTATNCPVVLAGVGEFRVVDVADTSQQPEVMVVTAASNGIGVTWTVIRGGEGTTPVTHLANFTVAPIVTSGVMQSFGRKEMDRYPAQPIRPRLTMITTFQPGHGFTENAPIGGTIVDDTLNYLLGAQAVTMTFGATITNGKLRHDALSTVDMTNKRVAVLVKVDNPVNLSSMIVYLGNSGLANFEQMQVSLGGVNGAASMVPGQWTWLYGSWATVVGTTGTPNRANITDWQFYAANVTGPVTVQVQALAYFTDSTTYANGVVSFSCDDSYVTQMTQARAYLDKYGYAATAFTIVDAVGSNATYMTLANLTELQTYHGWDIAGHAYTTVNHNAGFGTLAPAALSTELQSLHWWLTDNGFRGADYFAYPLGDDSNGVPQTVGQYFSIARSTAGSPLSSQYVDNPLRLRSVVLTNTVTLATAKTYVDKAKANGLWIVFTFHKLVTTPATSTEWAIADFQALVDYCVAQAVPVRTISEVLNTTQTSQT